MTGKTNQTESFNDDRYDEPVIVERVQQLPVQAGICKRHRDVTLDSIKKRGIPSEIKEEAATVYKYAANLKENVDKGVGLFLKGGVGTLKTTLAVAVMRKGIDLNIKTRFLPMVSLVDTIMSFKDNPAERAMFEKELLTTPILVLDDLGAEMSRDWVVAKIDAIITERYNRMLPTIITTNLGTAELKERYTKRMIDRLNEISVAVVFKSKSMRKAYRDE